MPSPMKKVKTIQSDYEDIELIYDEIVLSDQDEVYELNLTEPNANWIDIPHFPIPLSFRQKQLILDPSGWLDNSIVNGIIYKLRGEFPYIDGLQDTLYRNSYDLKAGNIKIPRFKPLQDTRYFVQIIHLETRRHWICITGYCKPEKTIKIDVYDSMNSQFANYELVSQVSSFFKRHETLENIEFVFHNVTEQQDSSSCGIHAIANAIGLCKGELPDHYQYDTDEMRSHLLIVSIIENGDHTESFPSVVFKNSLPATSFETPPVYCYCRSRDDGKKIIQCNRCRESFHISCVKLDDRIIKKLNQWLCDHCECSGHKSSFIA